MSRGFFIFLFFIVSSQSRNVLFDSYADDPGWGVAGGCGCRFRKKMVVKGDITDLTVINFKIIWYRKTREFDGLWMRIVY